VLLRPFVSTMLALVRILEIFDVEYHRSAVFKRRVAVQWRCTHGKTFIPRLHLMLSNQFLVDDFDVEPASTSWAVSKEFGQRFLLLTNSGYTTARSAFPVFFDTLLEPLMPAVFAFVRVLEFLDINDDRSTALLGKENGRSSILAKTQWSSQWSFFSR